MDAGDIGLDGLWALGGDHFAWPHSKGEHGTVRMSPVDVLGPQPHRVPAGRVLRHQRRARSDVFQVFADQHRLNDRPSLVNQSWNDVVRIKLHVVGMVLSASKKIHNLRIICQFLFREDHPNLLSASRWWRKI